MDGQKFEKLNRMEYFLRILISRCIVIIIAAGFTSAGQGDVTLFAMMDLLCIILTFWWTSCRCHDIGINGWWTLTIIIPFAILYFFFAPGKAPTEEIAS